MPNELSLHVMAQTGLPEEQASAAIASTLAFLIARLPPTTADQVRAVVENREPGPLVRYITPGFGTLARGLDQLRPDR